MYLLIADKKVTLDSLIYSLLYAIGVLLILLFFPLNKHFLHAKLTAKELVNFLVNWLIDHIADADSVIADYCVGKESEISISLEHIPMKDI